MGFPARASAHRERPMICIGRSGSSVFRAAPFGTLRLRALTGGSMRVFRRRSSLGFLALLAVAMQAVLALPARTRTHIRWWSRARWRRARSPTARARRAPNTRALLPPPTTIPATARSAGRSISRPPRSCISRRPSPRRPRALLRRSQCALFLSSSAASSVHFQARAPPVLLTG